MKKTNRRTFFKQLGIVTGSILILKENPDLKREVKEPFANEITIRGLRLINENGEMYREFFFDSAKCLWPGDQIKIEINLKAERIFDLIEK